MRRDPFDAYNRIKDKLDSGKLFLVTTTTKVKPHKIDELTFGNHCSLVENEKRFWGFELETGYNKFKEEYKEFIV